MIFETVNTEDGSISVRDPNTGELHHNRAGAYTEAVVNYAQPSGLLDGPVPDSIKVLDVCFGLGYNSFALLNELARLSRLPKSLEIVAIEIDGETLKLVPHALSSARCVQVLKDTNDGAVFTTFGDKTFPFGSGCEVQIRLINDDIRKALPRLVAQSHADFDVAFHDPFSPKHVPELWTVDLFSCFRKLLDKRGGRLMTYSAASGVRGGIREAGFNIWRSSALGGKTGGTVGSIGQTPELGKCIFPIDEPEMMRIDSASGIPYRDPHFCDNADIIRTRRLEEQFDWRQARMSVQDS